MEHFQRTLDGAAGLVTQQLTTVKRFEDIRSIWRDGSSVPLVPLPNNVNPFKIGNDTTPRYYLRHPNPATQLLQFYPKTATGDVYIHARKKPDDFVLDSEVWMDTDLLINGAAYDYAEDDGTNPGATEKFQGLFERRLQQLKEMHGSKPILLDPRVDDIPEQWFVTN